MSEEKQMFNIGVENGKLVASGDFDKDGEKSIKLELSINEAIAEAFKRGEKVEGVKLVDFSFELTKLKLKLDTDKDGEELLVLEVNLAEVLSETGLLK